MFEKLFYATVTVAMVIVATCIVLMFVSATIYFAHGTYDCVINGYRC